MIQAFVDDSGLHGDAKWFILSAVLGTAADWTTASNAWQAVLSERPRIAYFKMDEAAGLSGQFYGMSPSMRDHKLTCLARAVRGEYAFVEQTLTTDLPLVRRELKSRTRKPANDPYFWAFHHMINAIGASLLTTGYDEPFEVIFDRQDIFGPRARAWWPIFRAMAPPRLKAILPVDPLFQDDKHAIPLQVADLAAWMSRRDKEGNNPFSWLRDLLSAVKKSPHCVEFGQKEIALMFERGPLPAQQRWRVEAANAAFEETFIRGKSRHYVPKPKKRKRTR